MTLLRVSLLWLLLTVTATAHEISFSHVELHLDAGQTSVLVKIPGLALLQEEPTSLPAGTVPRDLAAEPLAGPVAEALARLVTDRLQLRADGRSVPLVIDGSVADGAEIAVSASGPSATGTVDVDANLFPTDTLHKIFVTVYRGQALAGEYVLDTVNPAFTLAAPERPLVEVVVSFMAEGIHHIFIGPDHILFVLALILLGGRLASQVKIITAFTVAHSITLVLATLGIVELPSRLVESIIALSIVVVGLHDLWQLNLGAAAPRDWRVVFAFVFGLVHGFGFAGVLGELDLPASALAWSLAAFNVGVEIGQVAIVLVAAPVIAALRRYAPPRGAKGVLTAAASLVVVVGSFWLWERAVGA